MNLFFLGDFSLTVWRKQRQMLGAERTRHRHDGSKETRTKHQQTSTGAVLETWNMKHLVHSELMDNFLPYILSN